MTTSKLYYNPFIPAFSNVGVAIAEAKLYFYYSGGLILAPIYADLAATTPLTNPVQANLAGKYPNIYLDSAITYRIRQTDKNGVPIGDDVDPYYPGTVVAAADPSLRIDLNSSTGANLIGITQVGTGSIPRTVQTVIREKSVSAADFATVAQAVATGKNVYFPAGVWTFSQVISTTPGQQFFGDGPASILRSSDATQDLFLVRASDVVFSDLRMEGAATSAATGTFAIKTDVAFPAPNLIVERVVFSGIDGTKGFNNAVKLDAGADYGLVKNCHIERLWGNTSSHGYGVLLGAVSGAVVAENYGVGTSGRGRHFCYLSSGASKCKVIANHVTGFDYEAIPVYSTDIQPTCEGNVIAFNTLVSCVAAGVVTSSAIQLQQNVQNTAIVGNYIYASGGNGIFADGTGSTKLKNNSIRDNIVVNSGYRGIDVIAFQGGEIVGNTIRESSVAVSGTYPNLRLASDGVTASSNVLISGNHCGGTTNARSSFQLNSTAPTPSNLKVYGNKFDVCNLTDVELAGVSCAIDGRIRAQTTWATGSIADGASATKTGISVPGAVSGDIVLVTHETMPAGWLLSGVVTAADTVAVTAFNKTGGASSPTGNLYVDVWKRA